MVKHKIETAIDELSNVFAEQKMRANQMITHHKQLQNKLSMIKHLIKYPEVDDNEWILNEIKKESWNK